MLATYIIGAISTYIVGLAFIFFTQAPARTKAYDNDLGRYVEYDRLDDTQGRLGSLLLLALLWFFAIPIGAVMLSPSRRTECRGRRSRR